MPIRNIDPVFPMRMVLGIILFVHGLKKVKGWEQTFIHFQADYGLPAWITFIVIFIEVVGGMLLILGLYMRLAAIGIASVMLGAICTVTWERGFIGGYEFNLALLAMALFFVMRKESEQSK